ncbi:hypothetical protein [Thiolapillus sp.]
MVQQRNKISKTGASAADPSCLRERRMFRLLLQGNPNYFGNALSSSLSARKVVRCNTWYEEIRCLGYNPRNKLLAAVICLHRPEGYATGTRISSEPEYVRFYLSFDDGGSWEDQGCASVAVHNAPTVKNRHHAVSLPLLREEEQFPAPWARVRAILSWNDVPPANAPEWKPVFGNVAEARVCLCSSRLRGTVAGEIGEEGGERLCGIGLAAQDDALLAVVHVGKGKRISSRHHVTFWLDADDSGAFSTYLGVVDMPLSALGEIPAGGADYVLRLPVDLEAYRQDCGENSRVLCVRGILSESEAGSRSKFQCVSPEQGFAEACLTVAPRVRAAPGEIAMIGGFAAKTAKPGQILLGGGSPGFLIQGVPLPRHSYVVEVSADGRNWQPLLEEVKVTDANGAVHCHKPDPETGHFAYLPFEENRTGTLACWNGAGVGKWQVRLRNYFGGILLPGSDVVTVCLPEEGGAGEESGHRPQVGGGGVALKPVNLFAPDGNYGEYHLLSA